MFKARYRFTAALLGLFAIALVSGAHEAHAQYANDAQFGSGDQSGYGSTSVYANQNQYAAPPQQAGGEGYTLDEVVSSGHQFFGATSGGLAQLMQQAIQSYGLPNGYVLGEEGSGAFIGGVRFGEGVLYTKNAGNHRVFWQGPSIGLDIGGDGARTMMLVYDLPSVQQLYGRYGGITGTAYLVGGFAMTGLKRDNVMIVPIKTGIGARLGINIGYLKMTPAPTWNPF